VCSSLHAGLSGVVLSVLGVVVCFCVVKKERADRWLNGYHKLNVFLK